MAIIKSRVSAHPENKAEKRAENRVEKKGLHPRNRHRSRYDFPALTQSCPELAPFVATNQYGDESIDFANPKAVRTLNQAILNHFYGISTWDIPENYLCPPIPGRADYIHTIADQLASSNAGFIPCGETIRVLDVGVGASCVYPIIGQSEYGWSFVGSEVDPVALESARKIVAASAHLSQTVELRQQSSPLKIFTGLIKPGELFDLTISNPPFHSSLEEAQEGTRRKWRNLGKGTAKERSNPQAPVLNFGGQNGELWCEGGEAAFVSRMIRESVAFRNQCLWFSTLISKETHLPAIFAQLKQVGVADFRTLAMAQGQKISRIVAWTFMTESQQQDWRIKRLWSEHSRKT